MPILRVRTGCASCRRRKKKCDETKPTCQGCVRNGLLCEWPAVPNTAAARHSEKPAAPVRVANPPQAQRFLGPGSLQEAVLGGHHTATVQPGSPEAPRPASTSHTSHDPGTSPLHLSTTPSSASDMAAECSIGNVARSDGASATSVASGATPPLVLRHDDFSFSLEGLAEWHVDRELSGSQTYPSDFGGVSLAQDAETVQPPLSKASPSLPPRLSLLPRMSGSSFELLGHYISMTSPSMDNGSRKAENPFSAILIPLAFNSDLILQLILTQSAVHRAARDLNYGDLVASCHYNRSLQALRHTIIRAGGDGGAERQEALTLAVGTLIMCFIEVRHTEARRPCADMPY